MKERSNRLRIFRSTLKDLSFRSRWSRWCPFFVMASVLRSHFNFPSKIVPRYLSEWTISTFIIMPYQCPGLLKAAIISLVLFTFRSRYDSPHHSVKS